MKSAVVVVVLIAGCDQIYGLTGRTDEDVGSDAPCALGDFDANVVYPLPPFAFGTFDPAMSSNGLELFYTKQLLDPVTTLDLRYATRSSLDGPWTQDLEIAGVNSMTANDVDPTITADGQSLLFVTTRGGNTVYEITRTDDGPWSEPMLRTGINVDAYSIDITNDGTALYVMDTNDTDGTLYRFGRTGIGMEFTSRTIVGMGMQFPTVNADESELFFHDDDGIKRAVAVGDLRAGGRFETIELVVPDHESADLSHDGMRLMYQTDQGVEYIQRGCKDAQ